MNRSALIKILTVLDYPWGTLSWKATTLKSCIPSGIYLKLDSSAQETNGITRACRFMGNVICSRPIEGVDRYLRKSHSTRRSLVIFAVVLGFFAKKAKLRISKASHCRENTSRFRWVWTVTGQLLRLDPQCRVFLCIILVSQEIHHGCAMKMTSKDISWDICLWKNIFFSIYLKCRSGRAQEGMENGKEGIRAGQGLFEKKKDRY